VIFAARKVTQISYTFDAFRTPPDADLLQAGRDSFARSKDWGDPGPLDQAAELRKQQVVGWLLAADANLTSFQVDFPSLAIDAGITLDEARRRHRHIYVSGCGPLKGVRCTVHDTVIWGTLDYLAAAPGIVERVWAILLVLQQASGYRIYDPQLDRVLDLAADREQVEREFAAGAAKLGRLSLAGNLLAGKMPRRRR